MQNRSDDMTLRVVPQAGDAMLEKLFNMFDQDGSGLISYPEFKQCWLRYMIDNKERTVVS